MKSQAHTAGKAKKSDKNFKYLYLQQQPHVCSNAARLDRLSDEGLVEAAMQLTHQNEHS